MTNKNFSASIFVANSPEEVFNAINNVKEWWSENITGVTDKLHGQFYNHYKDVHACKLIINEFVPGKKIVWHVQENHFGFTKDASEWKGNDIVFEISSEGNQTHVVFRQKGLTPQYECYDLCSNTWSDYISNSLYQLITTGKGAPTPKHSDGEFSKQLINQWKKTKR